MRLGGRSLQGFPAHRRARLGVHCTWQHGERFDDLTVRENLSVAAERPQLRKTWSEVLRVRSVAPPRVEQALDRLGIMDIADRPASEITEGQHKLVGVGRALASDPELVLLDEPGARLDSDESLQFGQVLRRIADEGTTMLLVDHDMGLVMSVCDALVVIGFGRVIAAGTPDEVRSSPEVIAAYLGSSVETGGE